MMTKTITFVACLGVSAFAGCSDEADIGIDIDPVTCMPNGGSQVTGTLSVGGGANGTYTHTFGATTVRAVQNPATGSGTYVTINDNELFLNLAFGCGPAERSRTYGVIGGLDQQQLACPDELYGSITGQIEILPAVDGVVIVDEGAPSSNCVAGRFHVDFGGAGDVTGWFSAPIQQMP